MRHVIGSTADKRRSHPTTSTSPTPNHTDTKTQTHTCVHACVRLSLLMNRRGLNEKAGMLPTQQRTHTYRTFIKVPPGRPGLLGCGSQLD